MNCSERQAYIASDVLFSLKEGEKVPKLASVFQPFIIMRYLTCCKGDHTWT